MDNIPDIFIGTTYYSPNKKLLKDWLLRVFEVSLLKDHKTLINRDNSWAGFLVKSGTFYYATLYNPSRK